MSNETNHNSLLRLLQLSDPALPIGGYAHSAGLETYVQAGIVKDAASAKEFVIQMLSQNLHYTDAAFVSLAFDVSGKNDHKRIIELDELCTAVKLPREMRQASNKLGMRLMKIFQPLCENEISKAYEKAIKQQTAYGHYCIAFGIYAQGMDLSKKDALSGFYYNAA